MPEENNDLFMKLEDQIDKLKLLFTEINTYYQNKFKSTNTEDPRNLYLMYYLDNVQRTTLDFLNDLSTFLYKDTK